MESWLKPMLCDTPAVEIVPLGDDWIMERKLDGWRGIVHRTATGVKLYGGRNGSDYTGRVPYIEDVLHRLPDDTIIDGELVAPAGWGDVQGTMTRTSKGPHVPTAADPPLNYVVFDVIRVAGTDVRPLEWRERRAMLVAAGLNGPLVFTSEVFPPDQALHEKWVADGGEGSVCKRVTSSYQSGARSRDWPKCKPQTTDEAKIIGFKPGKVGGSWDGKVGAFEVEMLDPPCAKTTVKCGDDARHHDATDHPENWLGKIIEIKHHGLSASTGKPRHPQFFRLREDRTPAAAPRTARTSAPPRNGKPWTRNYGAMGSKIIGILAELEGGYGDAYQRVLDRGGDLDQHIRACRAAAEAKGFV